jgi:riboflavin kinase/FMN adenylyltransferase
MRRYEDVSRVHDEFNHLVLTIGSFDGVHVGHQAILRRVIELARQNGGTAAIMTMHPHPREVFSPDKAPNLLTSTEKKLQLFEECGIEVAFVLRFTKEIADLDRRAFVDQIVVERCHAKAIIVGHDFCFGRSAEGNFTYLSEIAPECGFTVEQIPPLRIAGERVSSTLVRERLLQGDLERVRELLGRRYSITGEVTSGRGIGRKLGFPTANVKPHHSAVPAQGVYIAEVVLDGCCYPAAINIGIAPTIRHEDQTIEAFILDFERDILGNRIELVFHKRLRPEMKFPTYDALVEQIARDVCEAKAYFAQSMN